MEKATLAHKREDAAAFGWCCFPVLFVGCAVFPSLLLWRAAVSICLLGRCCFGWCGVVVLFLLLSGAGRLFPPPLQGKGTGQRAKAKGKGKR